VNMRGGADSFQMLMPHSGCEIRSQPGPNVSHDLHAELRAMRGAAYMGTKDGLLPISVPAGTQPCDTFGMHGKMASVKAMYDAGDALWFANMGSMFEPCTRSQFRRKTCRFPRGIFGHGEAQREAQAVGGREGVMGRMMSELTSGAAAYKSAAYTLSGTNRALLGDERTKMDFLTSAGASRMDAYGELRAGIENFTAFESGSAFAEEYLGGLDASLRSTNAIGDDIDAARLSSAAFDGSLDGLGKKFAMIAKTMKMDIADRGSERAAFYVDTGHQWDSHASMDLNGMVGSTDTAIGKFAEELKAQGVWGNVTIVAVSDFGRTLTGNTRGTDHGWGGNYWVAGGAVKGGRVLGKFPERLTEDDCEVNIGRGRLLPSLPFDAMWHGVVEWMGVQNVTAVLPNAANFPAETLLSASDLFERGAQQE